jgi:putative transposase
MTELGISERRACRTLGQHRSTQRKIPTTPGDEAALTADIIELARQYGRYGYRRITALLRRAGWTVNKKRVERIWRCEGLKVPAKQPKWGRLWLNDGSCIRLRPECSEPSKLDRLRLEFSAMIPWLGGAESDEGLEVFGRAQKAFILKQGADGMPVADICRKAGISQATYFNWKRKYDGFAADRDASAQAT